jgi:hypothetical protein
MDRPDIMQLLFGAQSGMTPTGGTPIIPNAGLTAANQLGQRETVGQFPSDAPLRQPAMQYQSPLLQNAMRQSGSLPFQQPETPAQPPMSMLDKIRTGLAAPSSSPMGMAINQASQALLQQSGYSPVPRTTGEIIGSALGAANQGFMTGKAIELEQSRLAAEQARLAEETAYQRQQDAFNRFIEQSKLEQSVKDKLNAADVASFGQEKDLRALFLKQSEDFMKGLEGFQKVQTAAMTKQPSGASDIALIFGYMKVLDPNSVVREGEFATAENAGGVAERIRNSYNRIIEGERLSPPIREQFIQSAREQFLPSLSKQQDREEWFADLSSNYGLNQDAVFKSLLPKQNSMLSPATISNIDEIQDMEKGDFFIIDGKLGIVE